MILDYPGVTINYGVNNTADPSDVAVLWTPSTPDKRIVISDIIVTAHCPVQNGEAYIAIWKGGIEKGRLPVDNTILPFSGWIVFSPGETLGYSSVAAGCYFICAQGSEY